MVQGATRPYAEAFFAAVAATSNDAIVGASLDGVITSWNAAAERLFGYRAAEAVGEPTHLIVPPDRRAEEQALLRRVGTGENVANLQTLRRHHTGQLLEVSINAAPVRDEQGRSVAIVMIVRDTRTENSNLERFRVTLASIGDAVISTDVEGRITYMNEVAEALTRWSSADAVGRPLGEVFKIVNELTREPVESPVDKVLREGVIVGLANHTVLIARDATESPIDDSAAPIRSQAGDLVGVVLVFRDVSEHRRAQVAATRLAAIVEGSEDAIVGKDLRGIITSWNPGAQRVFGYEADEMIGTSVTRLIPPERLNEEQEILGRLQRGERVDHFETVRIRKDGRRIHVSLTISPIRDGDGHIVGASKIARDITAQKQSEMALRAAQVKLESHALELERTVAERTAKLQEIVSELEAFSYSLSHDLRAPLRAIQGFTEIVLTDYGDRVPEATDYLRRVAVAATRMDRLIQDVLAFARVSRQEIAVGPVNLEKLVDDIVNERPELHPPQAAVEIVRPLLPVVGHDASLTQCLTNLLGNAVKFVSPGTVPHVRVFTERRDSYIRVNVQDNGIGIDPEGQRRLFTVFQRLANSRTYEGTGVGLAIVRKAAERMGGRVGVESTPGQGSTFWVELPAA